MNPITPSVNSLQKPSKNKQGTLTRKRILNAAEELFASKGFKVTTMRDIARLAPAELGSISYHFGTKKNVYDQVIERRASVACKALARELIKIQRHHEPLSLEQIVTAYVDFILLLFIRAEKGWLNYAKLALRPSVNTMHPAIERHYLPAIAKYHVALQRAMPNVSSTDIVWCFGLMERTFSSLYGENTEASVDPKVIAQYRRNTIPFFAAGLAQLSKINNEIE